MLNNVLIFVRFGRQNSTKTALEHQKIIGKIFRRYFFVQKKRIIGENIETVHLSLFFEKNLTDVALCAENRIRIAKYMKKPHVRCGFCL